MTAGVEPVPAGRVATELRCRLERAFGPAQVTVEDESEQHRGHAGWREGGETHFAVTVVAAAFAGLGRLDRQRRVYAAVGGLMGAPVHALRIRALTPEEAGRSGGEDQPAVP